MIPQFTKRGASLARTFADRRLSNELGVRGIYRRLLSPVLTMEFRDVEAARNKWHPVHRESEARRPANSGVCSWITPGCDSLGCEVLLVGNALIGREKEIKLLFRKGEERSPFLMFFQPFDIHAQAATSAAAIERIRRREFSRDRVKDRFLRVFQHRTALSRVTVGKHSRNSSRV